MKSGLFILLLSAFFFGSMAVSKKYVIEKEPVQWELEDGETPDSDDLELMQHWLSDGIASLCRIEHCYDSKVFSGHQPQLCCSVPIEGYFPPPDYFFS